MPIEVCARMAFLLKIAEDLELFIKQVSIVAYTSLHPE